MDRWGTLTVSLLMEAVGGSPYAFSVYAPQVRDQLNLTQHDISSIGSIGNLGMYTSIPAGLVFDAWGPSATGVTGGLLSLCGFALFWASVTRKIPPSVVTLCVANFIASQGSGWLDTCAISVGVRNFPHDRGRIVGLTKSLFGLSASIITLCYASFYKPDVQGFLLFLSILVSAVACCAAMAMRIAPEQHTAKLTTAQTRYIWVGLVAVLALAAYITSVTTLQSHGVLPESPWFAYGIIPMLLVHGAFVMLGWKEGSAHLELVDDDDAEDAPSSSASTLAKSQRPPLLGGGDESGAIGASPAHMEAPFLSRLSASSDEAAHALLNNNKPRTPTASERPGATVMEGLLSIDFFLILCMLFSGTGSGLVAINNLGGLVQSLGAPADAQDTYVVLLSVCNCLGRQAFGVLSDIFAKHISRPMWLALCVFGMAGSMLLMAFANLNLLYVAVACTGFFYGGFWSLNPTLVVERFGTRAFASLSALTNIASAAASYGLNTGLAASLYQSHLPPGSSSNAVCYGGECFRTTFLVLACLCVCGGMSTYYLSVRTRKLYDSEGKVVPYDQFVGA